MTRLRFKPCQQGNLDGLCGLYALVNALRCLCPKADQATYDRGFQALLRALRRHHRSPMAVIHRGLNRYELLRLVEAWQRFAAREFGVILTVSRLKVSRATLSGVWQGLCQALDGQSVALVGLDGGASTGLWRTRPRNGPCG